MQTPTAAPNAPTTPRQIIINGVDVSTGARTGPAAIYEALSNQREVLGSQLSSLENQREELNAQIQQGRVQGASRVGIEGRIAGVDKRIEDLEKQIAGVDAQIASTAAVPGAVIHRDEFPGRDGPPDEAFVLGGLFMIIVFLPLSIAFARRIWKRSSNAVAAIPSELMARLSRIEQAVDTSAVEIERIGEGQRFITKLFSENKVPALPSNRDNA